MKTNKEIAKILVERYEESLNFALQNNSSVDILIFCEENWTQYGLCYAAEQITPYYGERKNFLDEIQKFFPTRFFLGYVYITVFDAFGNHKKIVKSLTYRLNALKYYLNLIS